MQGLVKQISFEIECPECHTPVEIITAGDGSVADIIEHSCPMGCGVIQLIEGFNVRMVPNERAVFNQIKAAKADIVRATLEEAQRDHQYQRELESIPDPGPKRAKGL